MTLELRVKEEDLCEVVPIGKREKCNYACCKGKCYVYDYMRATANALVTGSSSLAVEAVEAIITTKSEVVEERHH